MARKTTATETKKPIDAAHPAGWVFYNKRLHFVHQGFTLCRRYSYHGGKVMPDDGKKSIYECQECVRGAIAGKLVNRPKGG